MTLLAVAAACAVMAGAALQSGIGFGFALASAPLLYAAAPSPEQAVGLLTLLGLEVNLLTLLAEGRRPAPLWRDVLAVAAWSLPGALAGVAILRALDELALQLLVTAGVLLTLMLNLRAARRARPAGGSEPPWWARPAAGLASGALNTSTSTGGPPIVLLLMSRGLHPSVMRDTLTAAFALFAPMTVTALALTGTDEAVPDAAWIAALVPLAALGHLAGRSLFRRLAARGSYERVLGLVLIVSVTVGLAGVALSR
jgi:uncharacterized membrane protein YfcA